MRFVAHDRSERPSIAMTRPLVHGDRSGDGGIEALKPARHWDGDAVVALSDDLCGEAVGLRSNEKRHGVGTERFDRIATLDDERCRDKAGPAEIGERIH